MQKEKNNVWLMQLFANLQLFADGAGEAGAAEGTSDGSGAESEAAAQEEMSVDTENATQYGTEGTETEGESFDELINGRYKDDFKKAVSEIVSKRVNTLNKTIEATTAQLEMMGPMTELLFEKYGIENNDYEALNKAILDDDSMYEAEAIERNMDIPTLKYIKNMERQTVEYEKQQKEAEEQAKFDEKMQVFYEQAEELKKIYPNFDFDAELKENELFGKLLSTDLFTVQNAFEAAHAQELETIKAKAIADVTAKKVAASVKANAKRPAENGLSNTAGSKVTKDPSSLSEAEIDKMFEEASAGKKISF